MIAPWIHKDQTSWPRERYQFDIFPDWGLNVAEQLNEAKDYITQVAKEVLKAARR